LPPCNSFFFQADNVTCVADTASYESSSLRKKLHFTFHGTVIQPNTAERWNSMQVVYYTWCAAYIWCSTDFDCKPSKACKQ